MWLLVLFIIFLLIIDLVIPLGGHIALWRGIKVLGSLAAIFCIVFFFMWGIIQFARLFPSPLDTVVFLTTTIAFWFGVLTILNLSRN